MGGGGGGGEGGDDLSVYWEEALDTNVSSVVASTASLGRQYQSQLVLGTSDTYLLSISLSFR